MLFMIQKKTIRILTNIKGDERERGRKKDRIISTKKDKIRRKIISKNTTRFVNKVTTKNDRRCFVVTITYELGSKLFSLSTTA